jgi:hypothetical protein
MTRPQQESLPGGVLNFRGEAGGFWNPASLLTSKANPLAH